MGQGGGDKDQVVRLTRQRASVLGMQADVRTPSSHAQPRRIGRTKVAKTAAK
jgi:hypothetical protein